jgi:hypothetical protein
MLSASSYLGLIGKVTTTSFSWMCGVVWVLFISAHTVHICEVRRGEKYSLVHSFIQVTRKYRESTTWRTLAAGEMNLAKELTI